MQGTQDLYIETSVFVDRDLYRHMLDNFPEDTEKQVLKVVLAMVNAVSLIIIIIIIISAERRT